jgi:acetyltransferase-like isoleucine patch superfamily enzyme
MSALVDRLAHRALSWLERRRVAFYLAKMNVGQGVQILPGLRVQRARNVFLGNDVRINVNCTLQAHAPIHILDLTMIAANCTVVTANHDVASRGLEAFETRICEPVTIGRGCWLGAGVIVLPGVTIGDGVVVGAGSVVAEDLPPETICLGAPARPVRDRPLAR